MEHNIVALWRWTRWTVTKMDSIVTKIQKQCTHSSSIRREYCCQLFRNGHTPEDLLPNQWLINWIEVRLILSTTTSLYKYNRKCKGRWKWRNCENIFSRLDTIYTNKIERSYRIISLKMFLYFFGWPKHF